MLDEILAAPRAWRLILPERLRSATLGEHLGREVGSSLEFEEHRGYVPGDDPRRIDWRATARSDQIVVKLFREEVVPRVDLLLDRSASMTTAAAKRQLSQGILLALALLARRLGSPAGVTLAGDDLQRLESEPIEEWWRRLEAEPPGGRRPLPEVADRFAARAGAGSLRVVVSDFLFPHDPVRLVRSFRRGAGGLVLVQILTLEERSPPAGGRWELEDVETAERLVLEVDEEAAGRYRRLLEELVRNLAGAARSAGALHVVVGADEPLASALARHLAPAGIVEPIR